MEQANRIRREKRIEHDFTIKTLCKVADMRAEQRSLHEFTRILAEAMQCSLILEETYSNRILASYPNDARAQGDCGEKSCKNEGQTEKGICASHDIKIGTEKIYHLCLTAQSEVLPCESEMGQALEAIRLYILIWDRTCVEDNVDSLIGAMIQGDRLRIMEINQMLKVDFATPKDIWILRAKAKQDDPLCRWKRHQEQLRTAKRFFLSGAKRPNIGVYDDSVVIVMEHIPYVELDEGRLCEMLGDMDAESNLYTWYNLYLPVGFCEMYAMLKQHEKILSQIYPEKRMFTNHDLHFAGICQTMLESGRENVSPLRGLLSGLRDGEENELLQTLETYCLDADSNTQKTGELLFMHNNTVKYRLHKIRQKLGVDIMGMPSNYNIYLALALERILRAYRE